MEEDNWNLLINIRICESDINDVNSIFTGIAACNRDWRQIDSKVWPVNFLGIGVAQTSGIVVGKTGVRLPVRFQYWKILLPTRSEAFAGSRTQHQNDWQQETRNNPTTLQSHFAWRTKLKLQFANCNLVTVGCKVDMTCKLLWLLKPSFKQDLFDTRAITFSNINAH